MDQPGAKQEALDNAMRDAVNTVRSAGAGASAGAGSQAPVAAASPEPRPRKRHCHAYPTAPGIAPRSPDRSDQGILARLSDAPPRRPPPEDDCHYDPFEVKITAEGYAFSLDEVSASPPLPPFRTSCLTQLSSPLLPLLLLSLTQPSLCSPLLLFSPSSSKTSSPLFR